MSGARERVDGLSHHARTCTLVPDAESVGTRGSTSTSRATAPTSVPMRRSTRRGGLSGACRRRVTAPRPLRLRPRGRERSGGELLRQPRFSGGTTTSDSTVHRHAAAPCNESASAVSLASPGPSSLARLRLRQSSVMHSHCVEPSRRVPRRHAVEPANARWDPAPRRAADSGRDRARRGDPGRGVEDAISLPARWTVRRAHVRRDGPLVARARPPGAPRPSSRAPDSGRPRGRITRPRRTAPRRSWRRGRTARGPFARRASGPRGSPA